MIISGKFLPGARLHEAALASSLGVSRAPLREALKTLATDGFVEIVPNCGAHVAEMDACTYRDILKIVIALEMLAADDACRNAADAQISEIADLHGRMVELAARDDLPGYFDLNVAIHQKIVDLAGNPTLSATYSKLNKLIWRQRYLAHLDLSDPAEARPTPRQDQFARSIPSHQQMVVALSNRDATGLKAALHSHYETEHVSSYLEQVQALRHDATGKPAPAME